MKPASLLSLGLAGLALILVTACGGAAPAPAATSAPAPATTAPIPTTAPTTGNGSAGQTLAQNNGCVACHSIDGSVLVGPSWQGIYGSQEALTDGTTATVDDDYIRESIVDPNIKIVEGFLPNLMPQAFGETLSDSDIEAITEYIKSLR